MEWNHLVCLLDKIAYSFYLQNWLKWEGKYFIILKEPTIQSKHYLDLFW